MPITLLMSRPTYYGIFYEINPWMDITREVTYHLAISEWENLYNTIVSCGTKVELIPPVQGLPDMVFTANAALIYHDKVILSHLKYKERQGELPYFRDWFVKAGYKVVNYPSISPRLFFEGAGDALLAGDKLFVGFGFRSDRDFYEQNPYLDPNKIIYCKLVNPYFYHIDTCFCPINAHQAIWYPAAFSKEAQKQMADNIELLSVSENEAKHFACNAVVLEQNIILPTGCPKIVSKLQKLGFVTHECEMSEYLKAGGACKCLTLRLD